MGEENQLIQTRPLPAKPTSSPPPSSSQRPPVRLP